MIEITVIVPVYNAEKYIGRCLDSIIKQTYTNWKAIIVNDGSTDGTAKILSEYERKEKRFLIVNQDNKGAGTARNTAIERFCQTGYIVFLDADDYVESNYFLLLSNHSEDVVFIDVVQRNELGRILKHERISPFQGEKKDAIIRKQMTGCIPWGGVRKAVKAELIKNNNIRYSSHKIGEEAIYSFLILFYAKKVGFISETVYSYIIHEDSLSNNINCNMDPWWDVAKNLKETLCQMGILDNYADTVNTFLFVATAVSIKRMAINKKLSDFKQNYSVLKKRLYSNVSKNFKMDKKSLNYKFKFFYILFKCNFKGIIYHLCRGKRQ